MFLKFWYATGSSSKSEEVEGWTRFRFLAQEDHLLFNEVIKKLNNGTSGIHNVKWWLVDFLKCSKNIKVASNILDDTNFLFKISTYDRIISKVYLMVCQRQSGLDSLDVKYFGSEPPQ
ncbi:hypothetical protein RF11_04897 [Thelohanellus kitauei]|uniref:Uncharacterized protein n=1 Tax=Thelohanellus kitauei TaxID=669202 RepID=A0A0C2M8I3_THEKT|nr:hypothetical protein RF11_04897 [Thelohanellus kitauei]